MRVMSVVGARPQFVKLAPVARAADAMPQVEHLIVHTGQHYDAALSDIFFDELGIPEPHAHLDVGSAGHGVQTGRMLAALEPVLEAERPDCVLVYGDTNSTLAAAIAAVKLHLPVAHLEAGLRSFNRRMPEEHNRVLVDHAADLLLPPTQIAVEHLRDEGLADRTVLVGDVMADAVRQASEAVAARDIPLPHGVERHEPYVVATVHRAENTDDPDRLAEVLAALRAVSVPVLLVAHPRLRARAQQFGIDLGGGAVRLTPPLGYLAMVQTTRSSVGVVTDSGGLQKEAFLLGVPCTTIRTETEWPETLVDGWNILDAGLAHVPDLAIRRVPVTPRHHPYGNGHAAEQALTAIRELVA
jgi:UDP-N-acetylglucosamine 2-epimerase (non-hydrolysing)